MSRFNTSKEVKTGGRFNIGKTAELKNLSVFLEWEGDVDLDVSAFLLGHDGIIDNDANFVFYGSENRSEPYDRVKFGSRANWKESTVPMSADGSVLGSRDILTGGKEDAEKGAVEKMNVDLAKTSAKVTEIVFCATIYTADMTFGDVKNPSVSVVNNDTDETLVSYKLNERFTDENALAAASLLLDADGEWQFNALGKAYAGGIETLIEIYAPEE